MLVRLVLLNLVPAVGVELRGFEPLASSMRTRRATNCATAPMRLSGAGAWRKVPPTQRSLRIEQCSGASGPAGCFEVDRSLLRGGRLGGTDQLGVGRVMPG